MKAANEELRKRLEMSCQACDDLEELEEYMSEESKDESEEVWEDKQKSTNSVYILLLGVGYL